MAGRCWTTRPSFNPTSVRTAIALLTYWTLLNKHFELCWGDSACGNWIKEAIRWFNAISDLPELSSFADLIRIEAAQMRWWSAETREQTAEKILSRDELFFEAHTRLNEGVYDVDPRLAAREHIYKAHILESAEKKTVSEVEANESTIEHFFTH